MSSILEDQKRFRDIVRGKIKENFQKYINKGEIYGQQEGEVIKIPVPSIEIPRFKYGSKNEGGGSGSGQGQPQQGQGQQTKPGEGKAGDNEGQHALEVEVTIDEMAELLGEKLQLPNIKPKGDKNIETVSNKFSGKAPEGPASLRLFKDSYKEALKRTVASGTYDPEDPYIVPIKRDMRYRSAKPVSKPKSNAVIIYMMDVSGSMGAEQKDIVRVESFWINTWLKKHYKGLESRFIIHDAAAKEVDEETFFKTSESGGTLISSAYKLAKELIRKEYPVEDWNIYFFHFSDGDNWSGEDTKLCIKMLQDEILPVVNMFGYGQVDSKYGSGQFYKELDGIIDKDEKLVLSRIEDKDKILESIKTFLCRGL